MAGASPVAPGTGAPSARSNWSILNIRACSERSACGWVAFSSAISSWMRGSLPSFTAAIAAARKSIARRISPCESRSAWAASRSVCSAVTENESGTWPSVWTTNRWRRCADRSRMNCVKSRPDSDSDCTVEQRRARVAVGQRLARGQDQLGVRHAEDLEHVVELHLVAAVGHELLERAERVPEDPVAARASMPTAASGIWIPSSRGHAPEHAGDLLQRRPLEVEAVAAVDDRRRHLVRLGRREHEHHVLRAAPRASSGTRSRPPA